MFGRNLYSIEGFPKGLAHRRRSSGPASVARSATGDARRVARNTPAAQPPAGPSGGPPGRAAGGGKNAMYARLHVRKQSDDGRLNASRTSKRRV